MFLFFYRLSDIIYTKLKFLLILEEPMNKNVLLFPGFKTKALTFSFDDGIDSDIETLNLLKKYDIKATFNLCSGHLADAKDDGVHSPGQLCMPLSRNQAKQLFADPHAEVASHGQYHPDYCHIASSDALFDMLSDRRELEELFGCFVRGHAYPFGNYSEEVMGSLRLSGFAYARTVDSSYSFALPREDEWLKWRPSCHFLERMNLERLTEEFTSCDNPNNDGWLLYIWGHSYEFRETPDGFEKFEELLSRLAFRPDTWYATNMEICEYVKAFRSLIYSADGKTAYNPTQTDINIRADSKQILIPAGATVKLK